MSSIAEYYAERAQLAEEDAQLAEEDVARAVARAERAEAEVADLIARHGELADRTLDAEAEVARLRGALQAMVDVTFGSLYRPLALAEQATLASQRAELAVADLELMGNERDAYQDNAARWEAMCMQAEAEVHRLRAGLRDVSDCGGCRHCEDLASDALRSTSDPPKSGA